MKSRILMVDDDAGYLKSAGLLLKAAGYDVIPASCATEARAKLAESLPDLILLDVIMPGLDGFTFADEIAKDARLEGIPIILVTAVAENAGQMMYAFEKDMGLSAAEILPKSSAHERLVGTVAEALKTK